MALQYSTAHRNACMSDIATQAGANATVKIFQGTMPANCATADAGTALVTLTGNATQFGTVSSGVLTVLPIAPANASNTGTAQYFRVYPSAATTTNAVLQGTVGASGADMNLSNTSVAAGQQVSVTSWTITAFGA